MIFVDHTQNGNCTGCGACCSNLLPLSKREIKTIARYIKKHKIEASAFPGLSEEAAFLTCPFYDMDADEKHCKIYDVRPAICVDFFCNKAASGKGGIKGVGHRLAYDVRELFFRGENNDGARAD